MPLQRSAAFGEEVRGEELDIVLPEALLVNLVAYTRPLDFSPATGDTGAGSPVGGQAVRHLAEGAGVCLVLDIAEATPSVAADPTRLQQVVWNLLTNAIKFTPAAGQVLVRFAQVEEQVQLTVADTGVSIAASFLPHLFERFRQADSSTTRKQGGLGLGLFIVRHIVEAHGGRISAESAGPGQGATFTVELPVLRAG